MLERLKEKDAQTVAILSDYLAEIIAKSVKQNPHKMSHALQDVISPAIAQGIADNKEKMIDALYPIMGGMISKYVTQAIKEMMEKINEKIEQGLSVDGYKRKIKAKLTGVSETELLLEESSDATIQSIFIIQKDTGLLLAEAHLQNSEIDDPQMVASMASAIKDFVNDWIENATETAEVQLLSYGNATLYIESAGSVYLIAFLDSEPDHEQRTRINAFFAKLIKRHSDFFQSFDGDDSAPQIPEIEEMIREFLGSQVSIGEKSETTGRNPAKLIFAALGIAMLLGAGYWAKEKYELYRIEKDVLAQTGEQIQLRSEGGKLYIEGQLPSYAHYTAIESYVNAHTDEHVVNTLSLSPDAFYRTLKKDEQTLKTNRESLERLSAAQTDKKMVTKIDTVLQKLSHKVGQLESNLSTMKQQLARLDKRSHSQQKKLSALEKTASTEIRAKELLQRVFENDPDFQENDASLNFHNLFQAGTTVPNEAVLKQIEPKIREYIVSLMDESDIRPFIKAFIIEGYTDSSGEREKNRILSQKRAKAVMDHILTLPINAKYGLETLLKFKGMADQNPVIVNGKEDKEASRRIKIRFEIDKEKILRQLTENLQKPKAEKIDQN